MCGGNITKRGAKAKEGADPAQITPEQILRDFGPTPLSPNRALRPDLRQVALGDGGQVDHGGIRYLVVFQH